MKRDRLGDVDFPSKFQLPSFTGLAVKDDMKMTCDMWLMARDLWHMIHDTWHMTIDKSREVDILSKFQLPGSNDLTMKVFWRWHVTPDMWLMTRDMWHMKRDTWHMTHDTDMME